MSAPSRFASRLAVLALLAAVASPMPASSARSEAAAPSPRIAAVVRPARVLVGGLVTVEVRARGLRDAGSVSFHLVYDPERLAPVSGGSTEGGLFRRDGARTTFLAQPASTGDRIIVGLTRMGRRRGADGNGVVARLVFRSLAAGETSVAFDQAELSDPAAQPVIARFAPGHLLVRTRKEAGRGR